MTRPKLVVLRGRPTSGKSTAFSNLQKRKEMKNWLFVDHCALKRGLGKDLAKKSLFNVLKTVMPTKKNIIVEETSRETIKKYINKYIKKYNYKIIIFQFTVSTKTAKKRDIKRVANPKHPHNQLIDIETMNKMHDKRFDKKGMLVNTNKLGKKQVVNFILKKLKEKM